MKIKKISLCIAIMLCFIIGINVNAKVCCVGAQVVPIRDEQHCTLISHGVMKDTCDSSNTSSTANSNNNSSTARVCCLNGSVLSIPNIPGSENVCHNAGGAWKDPSECSSSNNSSITNSNKVCCLGKLQVNSTYCDELHGVMKDSCDSSTTVTPQESNTQNNNSNEQPSEQSNTQNNNSNEQPSEQSNTQNNDSNEQPSEQSNTQNSNSNVKLCCSADGEKKLSGSYNAENYSSATTACHNVGGEFKDAILKEICVDSNGNDTGFTNDCEQRGYITYQQYTCPITGICCKGKQPTDYDSKSNCESHPYHVWKKSGTCLGNPDGITIGFKCDDPGIHSIMSIIKTAYYLLKYATPVILVIMGSIDFLKAVISSNAEDIEKNKKRFFNRLFIATLIFILASVFKLVTNILGSSGVDSADNWASCFNEIWIIINMLH